jgi:hypothetical protein
LRDAGKVQYQLNPQKKKGMRYIYETETLSDNTEINCNWHNGNNLGGLPIEGMSENECYYDTESIDIQGFEDGNIDGNMTVTSTVTHGNIVVTGKSMLPSEPNQVSGFQDVTVNHTETVERGVTESVTSKSGVTVCDQTYKVGDQVVFDISRFGAQDREDILKEVLVKENSVGLIVEVIPPMDSLDCYWYHIDFSGEKVILPDCFFSVISTV